jgi:hypothetical protein
VVNAGRLAALPINTAHFMSCAKRTRDVSTSSILAALNLVMFRIDITTADTAAAFLMFVRAVATELRASVFNALIVHAGCANGAAPYQTLCTFFATYSIDGTNTVVKVTAVIEYSMIQSAKTACVRRCRSH